MLKRTYEIRYVLYQPEQDYRAIIEGIKVNFPNNQHIAGGTWMIRTVKSAIDVRETLLPYIDADDQLLVVEVVLNNRASYNLPKRIIEWFKQLF